MRFVFELYEFKDVRPEPPWGGNRLSPVGPLADRPGRAQKRGSHPGYVRYRIDNPTGVERSFTGGQMQTDSVRYTTISAATATH
jgi:hypothetical protein